MLNNWNDNAIIYHIYPLGFCGAPQFNEHTEAINRISKVIDFIPHLKKLGFNAVYFGPVFESVEHGYDTIDYSLIDSRLGTNEDFKAVCKALHDNGIRVILDGVFNHVGRDFPAFRDIINKGSSSEYCDWFLNLGFDYGSPCGDSFHYEGWNGHYNLVKLNLYNYKVCDYLISCVKKWISDYEIDGLRLDAADCLNMDFVGRLKRETSELRSDFWIMGEIIHGDYNRYAHAGAMDSVTNYECYKGIYSSHNDKNYFEIGYSINRQSGNGGIYSNINLYNFVDNHDVNRLASTLKDKSDIKNCYTLLYAMPGIPSVYYASEFGIEGVKANNSDAPMRPCVTLPELFENYKNDLPEFFTKLGSIYSALAPLRRGSYRAVVTQNRQLVFERSLDGQNVYVALNCDTNPSTLSFSANLDSTNLRDLLNGTPLTFDNGKITITIPDHSAAIISNIVPSTDDINITSTSASLETASPLTNETNVIPKEPSLLSETDLVPDLLVKHFKGHIYKISSIATHTESMEKLVIYYDPNSPSTIWARPLEMFTSEALDSNGNKVPRFTKA